MHPVELVVLCSFFSTLCKLGGSAGVYHNSSHSMECCEQSGSMENVSPGGLFYLLGCSLNKLLLGNKKKSIVTARSFRSTSCRTFRTMQSSQLWELPFAKNIIPAPQLPARFKYRKAWLDLTECKRRGTRWTEMWVSFLEAALPTSVLNWNGFKTCEQHDPNEGRNCFSHTGKKKEFASAWD